MGDAEDQVARESPWKVKANEEFVKYPQLKREDLDELKLWFQKQKHFPQIVEDEMLLHFLHACFFEVGQAKVTIEHFFTYRTAMTDYFTNWDPMSSDTQQTIKNTVMAAPLPSTDADGNRVIICKLNDTNPNNYNHTNCVKWILITAMVAQWDLGIQDGYVIVYDCTGYSMSHLLKSSMSSIKNYVNWGKNASPIRVVKVIFINTSPVIKKLFNLIKPFLNKELLNMMKFYTDPEPFFEVMRKEDVPEDYGGKGQCLLTLHRNNIDRVLDRRTDLIGEEKMKSDESKRIEKSKKEIKAEKSFKNLEID